MTGGADKNIEKSPEIVYNTSAFITEESILRKGVLF